jgi:multidrug resistance efflux pump
MIDPTDSVDLEEARAKIETARERLRQALDVEGGDVDAVRAAVARLKRIEAEVARVEQLCARKAAVKV